MKSKQTCAALLIAALCAFVGCVSKPASTDKSSSDELLARVISSNNRSEALTSMILLEELRAGRTTNAIESLEFTIDSAICQMWHQMQREYDAYSKEQNLEMLKMLKAYRERFPRKAEGEIVEPDEPLAAEMVKLTNEAKDILLKLK